jgi:hypothetical protein
MATPNPSIRQVFISHATQDAEFAHRLAGDLQRLDIPIWIAPESIRPGEGWVKAIERGLRESSYVVIVLTPAALKSKWVEKETDVAIAQERKGHIKILPLDVEACEAPLLLSSYQKVFFRQNYNAGFTKLVGVLGLTTAPPVVVSPPHESPQSQHQAQVARPTALEQPRPNEPKMAPIPAGSTNELTSLVKQAWTYVSKHSAVFAGIAGLAVVLLVIGLNYPTVVAWLSSSPTPMSTPDVQATYTTEAANQPPTFTLRPAATLTLTPIPPPPTLTPTPTPMATSTPTGTPTATPAPKSTPSPVPLPTPTFTPRPTIPMPTAQITAPVLISPVDGDSTQTGIVTTFEWQWDGERQRNQGFDILIWKEGIEPGHPGAFDAAEVTQKMQSSGNTYQFSGDVASSYSFKQNGNGKYKWTVLVVEITPYARIGLEAISRTLNIIPGSGSGPTSPSGPGSKPPPSGP